MTFIFCPRVVIYFGAGPAKHEEFECRTYLCIAEDGVSYRGRWANRPVILNADKSVTGIGAPWDARWKLKGK